MRILSPSPSPRRGTLSWRVPRGSSKSNRVTVTYHWHGPRSSSVSRRPSRPARASYCSMGQGKNAWQLSLSPVTSTVTLSLARPLEQQQELLT